MMKIERVACEQFAGLTDQHMEFEPGLNLVVGDNESGKSTIVDLIFQMLFKDTKLSRRSDLGFIGQYFPRKVSGPQGDVIDGVLVFKTSSGTYKLKKEWESNGVGNCRLTLPDGTSIKDKDKIEEILKEELKQRAGVYSEIVFASQRRDQSAVECIMNSLEKKADPLSDTRADLTSTLTQAALQTGGVSIAKIEKGIQDHVDALIGRWDKAADAPEGGPKRASYKNAWTVGAGTIVKAYYEADEVRSKQAQAEEAEREVETQKAKIQALHGQKKEAEEQRNAFQKFRGQLGQISLLQSSIRSLEERIKEQDIALKKWPELSINIDKAKALQTKQQQARIHDLYLKAEPAHQACLDQEAEYEKLKEVDPQDLRRSRELSSLRQREESTLAGMNLAAKIRQLGSAEIQVTSAVTGKVLDLSDGEVQITEAVNIQIPGIMDMQLMPKGVDVEAVRERLAANEAESKAIFTKYGVEGTEQLQALCDAYTTAKQETERRRMNLARILGSNSWEEIKTLNDSIPAGIETEAEVGRQIIALCGNKMPDAYIGGLESTRSEYEKKYTDADRLKESIETLRQEKETNQKKLDSMDEIPAQLRAIKDPDQYDAGLLARIDNFEEQIKQHNEKLSEANRKLGDKSAEEYSDELQEKEAIFEARKEEYTHWYNIQQAFIRLKQANKGNPSEDIAKSFRKYMGAITGGNLKLSAMDDQLSVKLASGSNELTYGNLSEGTRDTISLAFRLAMLDHIFPGGDGLAVFDDPFTDMDPKRVKESCALIQKFAKNNQVIFITCDEKYKNLLGGHVITVGPVAPAANPETDI